MGISVNREAEIASAIWYVSEEVLEYEVNEAWRTKVYWMEGGPFRRAQTAPRLWNVSLEVLFSMAILTWWLFLLCNEARFSFFFLPVLEKHGNESVSHYCPFSTDLHSVSLQK